MAASTHKKQHPRLASPYTSASPWPQIAPAEAQVIQELLIALVSPIGRFRAQQCQATAAVARSKKRKRDAKKLLRKAATSGTSKTSGTLGTSEASDTSEPTQETSKEASPATTLNNQDKSRIDSKNETESKDEQPDSKEPTVLEQASAQPRIQSSILVGFNAVNRHLEQLASFSTPPAFKSSTSVSDESKDTKPRHVVAVFISTQPDMFNHLPALCTTASLVNPDLPPTRIVPLSDSACAELAGALGVGRLSCLGVLEGGSGTQALLDYVRERVPTVKVPWLDEVVKGVYMPVNVEFTESTPKQKQSSQNKRGKSTNTSTPKQATKTA